MLSLIRKVFREDRPFNLGLYMSGQRARLVIASVDVIFCVKDSIHVRPAKQANNAASNNAFDQLLRLSCIFYLDSSWWILEYDLIILWAEINGLPLSQSSGYVLKDIRFLLHVFEKRADNHGKDALPDL